MKKFFKILDGVAVVGSVLFFFLLFAKLGYVFWSWLITVSAPHELAFGSLLCLVGSVFYLFMRYIIFGAEYE